MFIWLLASTCWNSSFGFVGYFITTLLSSSHSSSCSNQTLPPPSSDYIGCFPTQTRLVEYLHFLTSWNLNRFKMFSPLIFEIRKRGNKDTGEKIQHFKPGRNRRSTGSGSVVLGWYRNVSVPHPSYSPIDSLCDFFLEYVFLITSPLLCSDCSSSLLADDVLGSFLLCPHPKKPKSGSLIVHFPSGLVTQLIENTRKGKFFLEVIVLSTT